MAGLAGDPPLRPDANPGLMTGPGSEAAIDAGRQYAAVAYLRWRLFANSFKRKGGKGELIARIIVYPIALGLLVLIVGGAGAGGFYATSSGHLNRLDAVFLAITLFQLLVSINIAPPALSFAPESLIRFPLRFSSYVTIRLMLGLLSASTVVGSCALLAAAAGVSFAAPRLASAAFAVACVLAVVNMLFVRMVFAWVDRWLATRRSREIFTGLVFLVSIGMQYLNVTFNNVGGRSSEAAQQAKLQAAAHGYHQASGYLRMLPSGRGAAAVEAFAQHRMPAVAVDLLTLMLFGAAFLAVFAWRSRQEYRGEALSGGLLPKKKSTPNSALHLAQGQGQGQEQGQAPAYRGFARLSFGLPADVLTCLGREWIYIRRNTAQIYSMVTPLAMVLLFAGRLGSLSRSGLTYTAAAAYALLGTGALAYNSLGMDGGGIQFYFFAPVAIRSVLLAKNLFGFAINALQVLLVYVFLCFGAGAPSAAVTVTTLLWAITSVLANASWGNIRSLRAPLKMDPGKLTRRQAGGLSALFSISLVAVMVLIGAGLLYAASRVHQPWLPVPFLAALAASALAIYLRGLQGAGKLALANRDRLIEALGKG